jgi:hypothetical protein
LPAASAVPIVSNNAANMAVIVFIMTTLLLA